MPQITNILFLIILSIPYILNIHANIYKQIRQILINQHYSEVLNLFQEPECSLTATQYSKLLFIAIDRDAPYNIIQSLINKVASFPDIKEKVLRHVLFRMLTVAGDSVSDGSRLHRATNSLNIQKKLCILDLIFNLGINPNIYMCSNYGDLLLFHAIGNEQPLTIIHYLLIRGADIHLPIESTCSNSTLPNSNPKVFPSLKETIIIINNAFKEIAQGTLNKEEDPYLELKK